MERTRDQPFLPRSLTRVLLIAVVAVIGVSVVWGRRLQTRAPEINLGAAPLVGSWHWRPSWLLLPSAVIGALVVAVGPSVMRRCQFWVGVALTAGTAVSFSLLLAAADGAHAILAPVVDTTEYFDNLDVLPPARDLLTWFSTRDFLVNYSVHLKGHPPGFILLIKGLAAIGLGHPWATGALSFVGVALMCIGVLVTVRTVASETHARSVAPFLAIAPFAVWLGTSADAFYTGVFALGVGMVASGARRAGRTGVVLCLFGGVTLAAALFLTYGAFVLLPLPGLLMLVGTRTSWSTRARRCGAATLGGAVVFVLFRHFGFWWFDGLRTTRGLYWEGTAKFRPWTYFLIGNLGALLIALGPATSVAIVRLRDRTLWLLVGSTLACVAVANVSQYSKGEVERIWLLFMAWLTIATATLRNPRRWLALQVATGLLLQAWLVSKW